MEAETPRVQYDDREHQVDYGQRLLPKLIDEIARSDPERQFAIVPRTADPEDGYDEIDFSRFGKAVDGCSWWLEGQLGKDAAHQTIAYYGSLDLMYHIVTLAAVKTGHTVQSSISRSQTQSLTKTRHTFHLIAIVLQFTPTFSKR